MALNYVTITGTFDDGSGNPLSGQVTFTPSETVYASGVPVASTTNPVIVQVISGSLQTVKLLATDNTGLTYAGLTGFFNWSVQITLGGVTQPGWSFSLPHSPSTVDLYSLANTGAGGFVNPMTAAGDLIDGGTAGAAQRLAIGSNGQFLQVVTGAPAWATPADFAPSGLTGATAASRYVGATASGAPVSGTFAVGDFVIDQAGKLWICTTAGTPGTWTAAGPTIPVTIAQGGTGQTTAAAAFNALSPMTTTGDIEYESGANTASRLAGNTSATKNFLTQTGTGSASAAPAWGTIAVTDIPSLTTTFTFGSSGAVPSSGTFVAGQVLVDQAGVVRVCLTSGTPGTWARAGQKPWEFYVDDYGALGNGKVFLGGSGTSGTATFTDTTNAPFVSGDTGKVIVANQGSNGGNVTAPFTGTITFSSSSSVTLSGNLAANAANCPYVYGTDDAAAIKNCLNAAAAFAATSGTTPANPEVDVIFSSKNYMLAGLTQSQTGISGAVLTYNAHIPVPVALQVAQKLVINFKGSGGAGTAPGAQYWESTIPSLEGTSLISAITPPAQPDASFGQMSIVGAPSNGDSAHFAAGGFANVQINFMGITVSAPWLSQICGVDGNKAGQMAVTDARAISFMPTNLQAAAVGGPWFGNLSNTQLPTNDVAVGFKFPTSANNANSFASRLSTAGFSIGVQAGEHMNAQELTLLYADQGYRIDMSGFGPTTHGHTLIKPTIEVCNHGIFVANGGSGQSVPIFVADLDMENIFVDHISDATSSLNGFCYVSNVTATRPVTNGASQLIVIDIVKHGPGPWSGAPAAPASGNATTNAQQNLAYRYATVYASATTAISATFAGPASTGLTALGQTAGANSAIPIRVPPGHYYSVTYTGTLTTVWELD